MRKKKIFPNFITFHLINNPSSPSKNWLNRNFLISLFLDNALLYSSSRKKEKLFQWKVKNELKFHHFFSHFLLTIPKSSNNPQMIDWNVFRRSKPMNVWHDRKKTLFSAVQVMCYVHHLNIIPRWFECDELSFIMSMCFLEKIGLVNSIMSHFIVINSVIRLGKIRDFWKIYWQISTNFWRILHKFFMKFSTDFPWFFYEFSTNFLQIFFKFSENFHFSFNEVFTNFSKNFPCFFYEFSAIDLWFILWISYKFSTNFPKMKAEFSKNFLQLFL